jgi:hypothetical protein
MTFSVKQRMMQNVAFSFALVVSYLIFMPCIAELLANEFVDSIRTADL